MSVALDHCSALVLNADYRPLSYFPLSLWSWRESIKAVFLDRVNVLAEYDMAVRSPSFEMALPSVIALKEYVPPARKPAFTRFNVFLRDRFECQYCSTRFHPHDLTFDHVIPRSRGGRTNWENVVTSCSACNLAKGNKMPTVAGFRPKITPAEPSVFQLQDYGRSFPPNFLHQSWGDYLYWDTELDND